MTDSRTPGELADELERHGAIIPGSGQEFTQIRTSLFLAAIKALRTIQASSAEPMNITVWKDGSYLCQKEGDDVYSRDDPEWFCSIPLVSAYLAAPPAPPEEWQPIESAPKDGTVIIVDYDGIASAAFWWSGWLEFDCKPGWRALLPILGPLHTHETVQPSRWQPLPAAPKGTPA